MVDNKLPMIEVSYQSISKVSDREYIKTSVDSVNVLRSAWNMNTIELYEEFKVLYLDRRNGVIGIRELSRGNVCGTVVDIRLLLYIGLSCNCSAIVISHNHPSGKVNPSNADTILTQKIHEACQIMNLKLLDHIILTPDRYYSFADEGLL